MACNYCKKETYNKFCSASCASLSHWSQKSRIDIIDDLHQIIEGTLFSDAGLELNKNNGNINPRYYFKQSIKYHEYVHYIAKYFQLEDKIKFYQNKSGLYRNILTYDARFKTRSSPDLLKYYNRWYLDGRKVIPKDFILTPKILLHSYLGDGYLYNRKSYYGKYKSPCQVICTDSFTENDILRFIDLLKTIDIEAYIMWHNYKPKQHPRVVIRRNSFDKFFNYIGQSPVKCFDYKWLSV